MKNINLLSLIFLLTLVGSSCEQEIKCNFAEFMAAPPGYTVQKIGTIPAFTINTLQFQMIDENIGYAHEFHGHKFNDTILELYKTTDGGETWDTLTVESDKWLHKMLFVDENNGYISQEGDSLHASVLVTTDGGFTWMERENPDFGFFKQMLKDQYGNLYGVANYTNQFLKSIDGGLSWTVIMTPLSFVHKTEIRGDEIYLFEDLNKIKVIDLDGNFIKNIPLGLEGGVNEQMVVLDSLNVIFGKRKTTDGGQTWTSLIPITPLNPITSFDKVIILDFSTPGDVIIIRDKDYCDTYQISVISSTIDGGLTWSDSEEMNNFTGTFNGAHKFGDDHYLVLSGNDIYELKR